MLVKKGNRILNVLEQEKDGYLKQGYDVVELQNKKYVVKESATGGRTYSIAEYTAIKVERDILAKELAVLKESKPKKTTKGTEDGK